MAAEAKDAQTIDPPDLRNLVETTQAPVVGALPDGSVEFANRAWLEFTGCSLQKMSGWSGNHDSCVYREDEPC
jgi:PAS domain-containing protein